MNTVKFHKHYITDGKLKARVRYSLDNRVDGRSCVTIYAKDHGSNLGKILADSYRNETEVETDYFDKGKAVLFRNHPLYMTARYLVAYNFTKSLA